LPTGVAELFLDAATESPLVKLAQESAIVASLALQSGCALETLRHALAGRGAGPLGAALAMVNSPNEVANHDTMSTVNEARNPHH
jgi:hypothetical protein